MRHPFVAGVAFVVVALITATVLRDDVLTSVGEDAASETTLTFDTARSNGLERPTWAVGDAWLVDVEGGPMWEPMAAGAWTCTLGIVEASPEAYRMGSSCPALAARLVLDPSLPFAMMGPGLGALQEDSTIEFFQWPLQAGRTWSTMWGEQELSVSAKYEPAVEGPLGKEPGFRLEMVDNSGARVATYNYVPSLRWWSHFEAAGLRLTVLAHGSDEALLTAAVEEVFSAGGVTVVGGADNTFDLAPNVALVYVHHAMRGASAQNVRVESPAGTVYSCFCSTNEAFGPPLGELLPQNEWEHARVVDGVPGTWSVDTSGVEAGATALTLYAVRLIAHAR